MTIEIFRYLAAKGRIARHIINIMPPHQCYCEPFGGSAVILLKKRPSSVEVYNDIYADLVNLFTCIQRNPETLKKEVKCIPCSRLMFQKCLEELKSTQAKIPDYPRAAKFLFFQNMAWSGNTPINSKASSFRLVRQKRNVAIDFYKKTELIDTVAWRLQRVVLENLDYKDCIRKYDAPTTLFYVDPPYVATSNVSNIDFTQKQHRELKRILEQVQGKWILTYDDCQQTRDMYANYPMRFVDIPAIAPSSTCHSGIRLKRISHLIITNFQVRTVKKFY